MNNNDGTRQVRHVTAPQNVMRHISNIQQNADQRTRKSATGTYSSKRPNNTTRAHASTRPSQRTSNMQQLLTKREEPIGEWQQRNNKSRAQSRRAVPSGLFQQPFPSQGTNSNAPVSAHRDALESSKTDLVQSSRNAIEAQNEAADVIQVHESELRGRYQTLQSGLKNGDGEAVLAAEGYESLDGAVDTGNARRQAAKRANQVAPANAATINIQKKQFPGQPQIPRHGSKRRSTMTQREPNNLRNYADRGIGSRKHSGRAPNQLGQDGRGSNSYRTLGSLDNLNYTADSMQAHFAGRDRSNGRRKSQSNPRNNFNVNGRVGTDAVTNTQNNRQFPMKQNFNGRVMISKGQQKQHINISNEHGYVTGGPTEAYTTQKESLPQYLASGAGPLAVSSTEQSLQSQQLQQAQTIQIQDMQNIPLYAERASSIDSAGYDLQNNIYAQGNDANSKANTLNPSHDFTLQPLNQGFSQMLKQTIINKAMEQKQAQIKHQTDKTQLDQNSAINQAQLTQKLQGPDNSYMTQVKELKHKINNATGEQEQAGHQSRLESLIQQLIIRKEITQSPAIQQQKRIYDKKTGKNLAQLSLQMANQVQGNAPGGRKISANGFVPNKLNFASEQNVQKHSAEDLLMIEKDISASPGGLNNQTRNQPLNQIKIKTNRPSFSSQQQQNNPQAIKNVSLNQRMKGNSASKVTGHADKQHLQTHNHRAMHRLSNEPNVNVEPLTEANSSLVVQNQNFTLSQNTDLPIGKQDHSFRENNVTESLGLPLYLSQNNQPQSNTLTANTFKGQTITDSNASFTGGQGGSGIPTQMDDVIAGMHNATIGSDLRINKQKQNFISLDQSKLLNQTNTNQSNGSLGHIYEQTLSAVQNDLNQLHQIDQTREEIGARLMKHQSILNSLQADGVISKRDSRQETSQNDIVLHRQMTHPAQAVQAELGSQGSTKAQPQFENPNNMYVFVNQNPHSSMQQANQQHISINSTLLTNQSHRGSVIESTLHTTKGGLSNNSVTLATSPIVGRYRLKNLNGPGNQINVYQNQSRTLNQNLADAKRTKSVRQRRGLPIGSGGSNLRGGRRLNMPSEQQPNKYAQTNIPGGKKKLDSLVLAYRSTGGGEQASLLNPTNSQQSFTGQGQTQTLQPQRKLLQTQDSSNLNQTYGVSQKFQSTNVTSTLTAKKQGIQKVTASVASGRSVPRQRLGGFSSNMRPPTKQGERSFSNNRNRAQQSYRNTSSFVARNTYVSAGSGSMSSQQQQQMHNMLHGSQNVVLQQSFNPNMSDAMLMQEIIANNSSVSPINIGHGKSLKYGRSGVVQQQAAKRGQKKSTSRGRGPVANSTSLAGPGVRKHSKITQGTKAAQMSQQQVYQIRGSLQTQGERGQQLTATASPGQSSPTDKLAQSRMSPDMVIKNMRKTPEIPDASPAHTADYNIRKGPIIKQTQINKQGSQRSSAKKQDEDITNQMSVGGQVIVNAGGIQGTGSGIQTMNRNHNLRYSQHNDDLNQLLDETKIQDDQSPQSANSEAQQRQDEAMKLINEDNPFENVTSISKFANQDGELGKDDPSYLVEYGVDKQDGDGSGSSQTMSFAETKSIASKTTNRASKNTNGTIATAGSGGLTNQLTFSKMSRKPVPSGGANAGTGTGGKGNWVNLAGAMRRSETTEDSQQCTYMDANMIMSSLPMPMHSIKQVIAEEEAAAEQDERTTNKESSKYQTNAHLQNKGSDPSKGPGTENQSSSNKDTGGDNNTGGGAASGRPGTGKSAKILNTQNTESESLRLIQSLSKANTNNQQQDLDEYNDLRISESGVNICETPKMSMDRAEKLHQDVRASYHSQNNKKQDLEYKRRSMKQSEDGNILLDDSNNSIQFCEDSGVIQDITPDIMVNKEKRVTRVLKAREMFSDQEKVNPGGCSDKRKQEKSDRALDDFPPRLSESSILVKPSQGASGHHSDDDVEVRRGLESENVRTDMGSNPELLRQSTHSLLHKTQMRETGGAAELLVLKKQASQGQKPPTKPFVEGPDIDGHSANAISDEIDVRLSNSSSLNLRGGAVGEARNNNFLSQSQSSKKQYTRKARPKAKVKQFEQFEDSEEMVEEIRVGQIDADEFILKK